VVREGQSQLRPGARVSLRDAGQKGTGAGPAAAGGPGGGTGDGADGGRPHRHGHGSGGGSGRPSAADPSGGGQQRP